MTKFNLQRVRLNQGGYTDTGQYFGIGMPLYEYRAEFPPTYRHVMFYPCDAEVTETNVTTDKDGNLHCPTCGHRVRKEYSDVCDYVRAYSRDDAKSVVAAMYPDATFYR